MINDIYREVMNTDSISHLSLPIYKPTGAKKIAARRHSIINSGVKFLFLYEDYIVGLIERGATVNIRAAWYATEIELNLCMGLHFNMIHKFSVNVDRILHMVNIEVSPKLTHYVEQVQIIKSDLKNTGYREGSISGKFVKVIDGIIKVDLY